ncbi:MAG: TonB-dependent receptor [Saprospiraceae bacterium]
MERFSNSTFQLQQISERLRINFVNFTPYLCSMKLLVLLSFCLGVLAEIAAQSDTMQWKKELETIEIKDRAGSYHKDVLKPIQSLKTLEILSLNTKSTADLLASSGKVFLQKSQQGGGSPIIRGFEANKILLVADNIRMNNAIYRGGHLQNIMSISPILIESIDVLQGPGSVLYGSDAIGGIILLKTKALRWSNEDKSKFNFSILGEYGNQAWNSAHFFQFGKSKWAWTHAFSYSDFFHLKSGSVRSSKYPQWGQNYFERIRVNNMDSLVSSKNTSIQFPSAYRQWDLLEKVGFKSKKLGEHVINFQYSSTTTIDRYDRLSEYKQEIPASAQWYYGPQQKLFVAYEWDKIFHSNLQLKSQFSVQNILESRHNRNWNNAWLKHRNETVDVYQWSFDVIHDLNSLILKYGFDNQWNNVKSEAFQENILTAQTKVLDTRYPDGGSQLFLAGLFGIAEKKWSDRFTTDIGLRASYQFLSAKIKDATLFPVPVDHLKQKNTALNYSVGFHSKLWKNSIMSFISSSGFRSPNVDDLAKIFESTEGRLIIPNQDLKPEKIYNQEINFAQMWRTKDIHKFNVTANYFYAFYNDAIVLDVAYINGLDSIDFNGARTRLFSNQNNRNAYLNGFSVNFKYEYKKRFFTDIHVEKTFSRIVNEAEKGLNLDHIPPLFGRFSVKYIVFKNLQCNSWILYNAWKKKSEYNLLGEDNFQYATIDGTPSWMTLNFGVEYQMNSNWQSYAKMENCLDTHYRPFASGISAAGRTFVLGIRYQLKN